MIYKLKYTAESEAITDLQEKGIIDSLGNFDFPTHNIVYIGLIPIKDVVSDVDGNIIEEAEYLEGYHVDIMDDREDLDFGDKRIFPNKEFHRF